MAVPLFRHRCAETPLGTAPNQTLNGLPEIALTSGSNGEPYNGTLSYQPGQRLSRCTCAGESHPGPVHEDGTYVGRSAPEIDVFLSRNHCLHSLATHILLFLGGGNCRQRRCGLAVGTMGGKLLPSNLRHVAHDTSSPSTQDMCGLIRVITLSLRIPTSRFSTRTSAARTNRRPRWLL